MYELPAPVWMETSTVVPDVNECAVPAACFTKRTSFDLSPGLTTTFSPASKSSSSLVIVDGAVSKAIM